MWLNDFCSPELADLFSLPFVHFDPSQNSIKWDCEYFKTNVRKNKNNPTASNAHVQVHEPTLVRCMHIYALMHAFKVLPSPVRVSYIIPLIAIVVWSV